MPPSTAPALLRRTLPAMSVPARALHQPPSAAGPPWFAVPSGPAFFGNNMDALIDCLSYLDEREAEMTGVHVRPGDTLAIQLGAVNSFRRRYPDQFEALQDTCAFVSWHCTREYGAPLVALSYYD
ncbi:barstar family protein [Paraburkholderia denitrificans]|uniref:Barstar family protein n=1 Tax=Paraburkholderia denitrificans TaxID=694025 RepID=A0ABW0J3N4_9BURK